MQGWRHLCHPERSEGSACNARKQIPRYARDDNRQVSPAPMLLALNKPFHVLCQFTDRSVPPRRTLAEFGLPAGVYPAGRSEEHTSELQSLMRISYAVFCLKKKKKTNSM